jgi:transcriptional regulator with XRE-family HTH domain
MSDLQKPIIENYLKAQKKTKRELAEFLDIKENSINRTLKSPNLSIRKLRKMAEFFDVEIHDLLANKTIAEESKNEFKSANLQEKESQAAISNLSEAMNRSTKVIDNLVKIIANYHFTVNSNP